MLFTSVVSKNAWVIIIPPRLNKNAEYVSVLNTVKLTDSNWCPQHNYRICGGENSDINMVVLKSLKRGNKVTHVTCIEYHPA